MYYTVTLKFEDGKSEDNNFEFSTSNYNTAERTFWGSVRGMEDKLGNFELTWLKNNHHSQEPLVLMHLTKRIP